MMSTNDSAERTEAYPAGQRLFCEACQAEVEIIQPCTCNPPDQIFRCCGEAMKPIVGQDVHVGVE